MEEITKVDTEKSKVSVSVDRDIYSLEAIYDAAYNFLEKVYVFLKKGEENSIEVQLKSKEKAGEEELMQIAGEFLNELVNTSLRISISKENKMIREYIVSTALIGASRDLQEQVGKKENERKEEKEEGEEDPLGIAVPWEEKNKGKKQEE